MRLSITLQLLRFFLFSERGEILPAPSHPVKPFPDTKRPISGSPDIGTSDRQAICLPLLWSLTLLRLFNCQRSAPLSEILGYHFPTIIL
jgi:hypothetical protein